MGLFVGDQLDNKTERHIAVSLRLACLGIGIGGLLAGIGIFLEAIF